MPYKLLNHLQVLAGHNVMYGPPFVTFPRPVLRQRYFTLGQALLVHPLLQINSTFMLFFPSLSNVVLVLLVHICGERATNSSTAFDAARAHIMDPEPRRAQISP